ncbi:MAG: ABC transporter permease [Phycisphaerae bacterium]|nr:ABC transporter permease [Phycisphaerae bacterium]
MFKTLIVAWREFLATVSTKGFILGVVLPPVLMTGALTLMPLLMNLASPPVTGHLAVIDQTGEVGPRLEKAFDPGAMQARRDEKIARRMERSPVPMDDTSKQAARQAASAQNRTNLTLKILPPETDPAEAKKPIEAAESKTGSGSSADSRLALAVIPRDAVAKSADGNYGRYELFTVPRLDVEVQDDMREQIGRAVVDARLAGSGLDPANVRALMASPVAETKSTTDKGDRKSSEVAQILIPMGFMVLLWIAVFTGGQYLLSSTIEEKSNRVIEVLLSAVSPMQLMTGKILGQMLVAGVILAAYAGLGTGSLFFFQQEHLIDPLSFLYLAIFFVIAFTTLASMMAAIGAAVNDVKEAQALLGPVMIVLVIPMMLWLPLSRNPNSLFAQVCSFVPPINSFVMVLRLGGSQQIPAWQAPVSILVGALFALFSIWAAAKIFRIGVLMYGKPPNIRTLARWIRMA